MAYDETESIIVPWGDKMVTLRFSAVDLDIDVDDLVRIDSSNPVGEMLTVSTLLNKCGIMRAQAEYEMKMAELKCNTAEAEFEPEITRGLIKFTGEGEKRKAKYPTIPQVASALKRDKRLIKLKEIQIAKERDYAYLDNLYWAVKSKDAKVSSFFHKVVPEGHDSEIVDGTLNGIRIKSKKKTII
jgi:hypothetical protein